MRCRLSRDRLGVLEQLRSRLGPVVGGHSGDEPDEEDRIVDPDTNDGGQEKPPPRDSAEPMDVSEATAADGATEGEMLMPCASSP
jgi:hypothetical protein